MCLVEVKPGPPKPQASCALPAADNQVVSTTSAMVNKARQGVMEFLLINHPLDCPICDQGGECDLQDQALAYGRGHSRYHENKRAVTEKYMGPLIKTVMTRCIHCTRCVRFAEEVAGVEDIGAIGRGENMQITSYLESAVRSELSGNVIDLCPVGALTSKPYAFEARPWELKKTESIDVMDAVGTNIVVGTRGAAVMRVTPRVNDEVNEEWASDVTRFACDGLARGRLDAPYVRTGGKLVRATWAQAFDAVKAALAGVGGDDVAAVAGDLADVEAMVALKDLLGTLGSARHECRVDGMAVSAAEPSHYRFNTTLAGIETADVVLLVGTDLRHEAPLVNTRVRKAVRRGGARAFNVGPAFDLTYPVTQLGDDAALLGDLPAAVADALTAAARPAVIVGAGVRSDVLAAVGTLVGRFGLVRDGWNGVKPAAHRGEPGRRARHRLRGRWGHGRAGGEAGQGAVQPRRRRGRRSRRLQDLHRPSRRPRRARRRRHPAGCGVHREVGDLRQPRGPGAAGPARDLPAGRGARGLDDPARPVGGARPSAAVRRPARAAGAQSPASGRIWARRG